MAVGFFVDEGDEHLNSSYHTTVLTTNSATQTPLQSPVNREYLVQVFCEALNRCSIAGKYHFFVHHIFFQLNLSLPCIEVLLIEKVFVVCNDRDFYIFGIKLKSNRHFSTIFFFNEMF